MGSLGKRRGPQSSHCCAPACLSRSLSACLSFLGLSSAGEILTALQLSGGCQEAAAGPDLGCFLPVSVSHLVQGPDRDNPKPLQVRILQLRTWRNTLGGSIPRVPQGKAPTTEAMQDDFQCMWAPCETALVHTVRKLVSFQVLFQYVWLHQGRGSVRY